MKTIAILFEKETEKNYFNKKRIKKLICKTTTAEEHGDIRRNYLDSNKYNLSLSLCHWTSDEEAEEIAQNTFDFLLDSLYLLTQKEAKRELTEAESAEYLYLYEFLSDNDQEIPFGVEI